MNVFQKQWSMPLALLVVAVMAYGLLIPALGFYGDDWSYIYYHKLMGFDGPGKFAAFDRPFSAPFYNITIAILGLTPLPYHIFLLILRWLSAVLLWLIFSRLWPSRQRPIFWMAVFFLLYPGFSQQPISVEYILHFSGLDLTLLSMLFMLVSLTSSKRRWIYIFAGVLASANIFAIEYFIGLEMLRPVVLWIGLQKENLSYSSRLRKTFVLWLPYLIVVLAFIAWRVFFFQFPTYGPGLLEKLAENPVSAVVDLLKRIAGDSKTVLYDAWRQAIRIPGLLRNRVIYVVAVLVTGITLFWVHARQRKSDNENSQPVVIWKDWAVQPIILGGFALLAAGWPFWITGISIQMGFPWDRPTLPFMLGASLLLVGAVELVIRSHWRVHFFLLLALVAVGFHVANAEVYQAEWRRTREFFWQLAWRIPSMEQGTILASDDIPLYRVADSAMSAPLNWIYAPGLSGPDLDYKVFDLHVRIGTEYSTILGYEEDLPIQHDYRSSRFRSTTSHFLVFTFPEHGCLHLLNPEDRLLPGLPEKVYLLTPLSKPGLIQTSGSPPQLPSFFQPEPEHDWCYYLLQAELAGQREDWQEVVRLSSEAAQQGFAPGDLAEWRIFIEAYARTNNPEQAVQYSLQMAEIERLQPAVCRLWQNILADETLQGEFEIVYPSIQGIGCTLD